MSGALVTANKTDGRERGAPVGRAGLVFVSVRYLLFVPAGPWPHTSGMFTALLHSDDVFCLNSFVLLFVRPNTLSAPYPRSRTGPLCIPSARALFVFRISSVHLLSLATRHTLYRHLPPPFAPSRSARNLFLYCLLNNRHLCSFVSLFSILFHCSFWLFHCGLCCNTRGEITREF